MWSTALGLSSTASGDHAAAVGGLASASAADAIAMGTSAKTDSKSGRSHVVL
ncbi:hypothetical protein [Mesorhizobium humile]|uniref:hypothetical protein n=1 Tax=Mesorhizobium humile TaxID=3072313 RepID=UPI002A24D01C|nr:hypothetical protein [Mesorhizobium sp. VK2D]MDX8463717.1 hypothetical protein [Mesorhizobium sp. VK2D]